MLLARATRTIHPMRIFRISPPSRSLHALGGAPAKTRIQLTCTMKKREVTLSMGVRELSTGAREAPSIDIAFSPPPPGFEPKPRDPNAYVPPALRGAAREEQG